LRLRLEAAHAATEAALEEARGRVILSPLSYIAVSYPGYKSSTG
jgi:hypothetical protein